MKLLALTACQEDRAADKIARRARRLGVEKLYGIKRGGLPLALKVSYRMDDMTIVDRVGRITSDTLIIDDIIHSGKTMQRLLHRLEMRGVYPWVACWIWRENASYKPHIIIRTIKGKKPVKFPSETKKSALASFKKSEQGR